MIMKKKCVECGKEFEHEKKRGLHALRICSDECRKKRRSKQKVEYFRTEKGKEAKRKYTQSEKGKQKKKNYLESEKGKETIRKCRERHYQKNKEKISEENKIKLEIFQSLPDEKQLELINKRAKELLYN